MQRDRVVATGLGEGNLNALVQRGWDILAHEVRLGRQFAVAAIHQHRELNALRPAEVMHCIERGPDGSSFEQHIIHQHDDPTLDIEWHLGGLHGDHAPVGDVVAMHADINHAARDWLPPDVAQQPG